ncbi:universal stress protein [Methanomethylovorans sp.]|uniref:universal stress protein n=2 Tax=Methanomethylovorans sp. TaxID=2758717 RepID=UPI000B14D0DA|nr:universal stress protein [Methanomethylovorans sp.]
MMKILLPTDGSIYSENAARITKKIGNEETEFIVLHVLADKGTGMKSWQNEGADIILSAIENILVEMGFDSSRIKKIVEEGNAPAQIADVANRYEVDLVVMGNHGRNNGLKKIMGSVTTKVLELSERLILVVPPNYVLSQIDKSSAFTQTLY